MRNEINSAIRDRKFIYRMEMIYVVLMVVIVRLVMVRMIVTT